MPPITPNADWLRAEVRRFVANDEELTDLLDSSTHSAWPIGFYACRDKTSGSGNWSDHAWGNALDIMRLWKGTDPVNAQPGVPHYLDRIYEHLEVNLTRFDLRRSQLLWRVPQHFNHIHASFNHRGVGDPPCDGAPLRTIEPTGSTFVLTAAGGVPDPSQAVPTVMLQRSLIGAGYDPGPADGIPGPKTAAAWEAMMIDAGSAVRRGDTVKLL